MDNEIKQGQWKFDKWKHELQIDEVTFEFDQINRSGSDNQPQIKGCNMLPHLKPVKKYDNIIFWLSVILPIMFAITYELDLNTEAQDYALDPTYYGTCFNDKTMVGKCETGA